MDSFFSDYDQMGDSAGLDNEQIAAELEFGLIPRVGGGMSPIRKPIIKAAAHRLKAGSLRISGKGMAIGLDQVVIDPGVNPVGTLTYQNLNKTTVVLDVFELTSTIPAVTTLTSIVLDRGRNMNDGGNVPIDVYHPDSQRAVSYKLQVRPQGTVTLTFTVGGAVAATVGGCALGAWA